MEFIAVILTLVCMLSSADASTPQTYMVQLDLPESTAALSTDELVQLYRSFLPPPSNVSDRLVHSYHLVMYGFAASLTPEEAKVMENLSQVLSVRPQKIIALQTTHTPSFLGLQQNLGLWPRSNFGEGVIIGLLDTGITPNHPAFNDEGVSPPPAKWKGKCELKGTACNKKVIGARNCLSDDDDDTPSVVDQVGHGTHTASTAAGNFVPGANVLSQASGTAAGMAPLAHIAIYKVCRYGYCSDADILAGMDAAIQDGVDVISMSLGGESVPFHADVMAIGAYRAMEKGIFVSCAAGNGGPSSSTLSNEAPWVLTVGAGTVDRAFRANAILGDGKELEGEAIYQPNSFQPVQLPLVFPAGGANSNNNNNNNSNYYHCSEEALNETHVEGKIVLCQMIFGGGKWIAQTVRNAGGVAVILVNGELSAYDIKAETLVLPATIVSYAAGQEILHYINSTDNPTATIVFKGTVYGDNTAPAVASFSSRGPSLASPGILKPDLIGPGANILAAWINAPPLDNNSLPGFRSNFFIASGTSMATPHLSGIAALLKSAHPEWSPAAMKSAMMTTADSLNLGGTPIVDEELLPAGVFSVGAGHVNPSKAVDPGLVYDLTAEDYVPYLCGLNYSNQEIQAVTQHSVDCSTLGSISEADLNYPTILVVKLRDSSSKTYNRTLTNVGPANSSYQALVSGLTIDVVPKILEFTEAGQKLSFQVKLDKSGPSSSEGSLVWRSLYSLHVVLTKVVVVQG